MKRAVAIGDERRLAGYALAGADVRHAASAAELEAAWAALDPETGLLVLTPEAERVLEAHLAGREDLIWVVVPS